MYQWRWFNLPVRQHKWRLLVWPVCQRFPHDLPEPQDAVGSIHSTRQNGPDTWKFSFSNSIFKILLKITIFFEGDLKKAFHYIVFLYLVSQIHVGLFGDEQGNNIRSPLLWSQVQGRDALEGLGIGRRPILQQTTGHFHLVLLGCYVKGSVAILWQETGTLIHCLS